MFDFLLLGSGFVELVDMDDCCGVVLFEFIDIDGRCWGIFTDCHFFTQLFIMCMDGIGGFIEIRNFYPLKLPDSRLSLGEFF